MQRQGGARFVDCPQHLIRLALDRKIAASGVALGANTVARQGWEAVVDSGAKQATGLRTASRMGRNFLSGGAVAFVAEAVPATLEEVLEVLEGNRTLQNALWRALSSSIEAAGVGGLLTCLLAELAIIWPAIIPVLSAAAPFAVLYFAYRVGKALWRLGGHALRSRRTSGGCSVPPPIELETGAAAALLEVETLREAANDDDDDDDWGRTFNDVFSQDIMANPVTTRSGHTFDLDYLVNILENTGRLPINPSTGQQIIMEELVPNRALMRLINTETRPGFRAHGVPTDFICPFLMKTHPGPWGPMGVSILATDGESYDEDAFSNPAFPPDVRRHARNFVFDHAQLYWFEQQLRLQEYGTGAAEALLPVSIPSPSSAAALPSASS